MLKIISYVLNNPPIIFVKEDKGVFMIIHCHHEPNALPLTKA
jgi:hypothetical protein